MDRATAEQIAFLLPGLTHSMGNAMFAIQGRCQVLDAQTLDRDREAIAEAAGRASRGLRVLAALRGDREEPAVVGAWLADLGEYLRVPMRDYGVGVQLDEAAEQSPALVDAVALCMAIVESARRLVAALPDGFEGELRLGSVAASATGPILQLRIATAPQQLPFPVDYAGVAAAVQATLERFDVAGSITEVGDGLDVALPAAPAHS